VLGADGFGRSDTRENLRRFFEINRYHIVVAALKSLADNGKFDLAKVDAAIKKYDINPDISAPWLV
jgi:pyruvate dehydrogenase E1 component